MWAYDFKKNEWIIVFETTGDKDNVSASHAPTSPLRRKTTLIGQKSMESPNIGAPSLNRNDSVSKAQARRTQNQQSPVKIKLPKEPKKKDEKLVELESPTSVSMKNSLMIKNHCASFDVYSQA